MSFVSFPLNRCIVRIYRDVMCCDFFFNSWTESQGRDRKSFRSHELRGHRRLGLFARRSSFLYLVNYLLTCPLSQPLSSSFEDSSDQSAPSGRRKQDRARGCALDPPSAQSRERETEMRGPSRICGGRRIVMMCSN